MEFGYARVSTQEQNLDRQLDSLNSAGAEEIIQEKITGTKADRPELNRLLDKLRKGDVILVSDLTRLSRSTKDLFGLVDQIERKGANIKSLKESWLDTTTPQGKLMFTFMAGISQFERDLISQRTKEGLEAARARGRKGGRKPKLDDNKKKALYELYQQKKTTVKDLCDMFSITKPTLYKVIEEISTTIFES
ncbi:MAG TPA: recombinase family protein [Clostridium sp.]|jgi:DNA invertase Pin-like site-specific DNA recombinase|uniref:recombinase family protein n=1 Tax=Clostridium sp. TaxID=1506 RepID=UPI002F95D3CC